MMIAEVEATFSEDVLLISLGPTVSYSLRDSNQRKCFSL